MMTNARDVTGDSKDFDDPDPEHANGATRAPPELAGEAKQHWMRENSNVVHLRQKSKRPLLSGICVLLAAR